jgi:branched-chain amino acid transport system permease protein/neutral amino acid transport system permease protein
MEGPSNVFSRAASAIDRLPLWSVVVLYLLAAVAWMGVAFGSIAVQAAIQGLVVGSIYVLGAAGLSLTYGIRRFANFAHGDYMTVGAYAAFFIVHPTEGLGQHVFLGVVAAVLSVAVIAMLLEIGVFRRLEGRPTAALIASVGIALVIQNVISAIFLPDVRTFPVAVPPDFAIGDTGLTFNAVEGGVTLGVSVFFIAFLHLMLKYTTLGKAMRACADDLDLARTSGINTRNVILWTWAIAGAFAGVAGVLLAISVNVFPLLGFFVLLFIFAAVIIGGIGSPYGAMLGGLIVGFVQKLSNVLGGELQQAGILEGGSAYEPAGAFIIMIVVLLLKPEGIMGTRRPGPARRALRLPTWGRGGARRGV